MRVDRERAIVVLAAGIIGGVVLSLGVAVAVGGVAGFAGITTLDETVVRVTDGVTRNAAVRAAARNAALYRATLMFALGIVTLVGVRIFRAVRTLRSFWVWWYWVVLFCGIQGATKALDLHRGVLMGWNTVMSPSDVALWYAKAQGGALAVILATALIAAATARGYCGAWPSDTTYLWRSGFVALFCATDWACLWFWYSW